MTVASKQLDGSLVQFFDSGFLQKGHRVRAVTPATAATWRGLFEYNLKAGNRASQELIPASIIFGGAKDIDLTKQMAQILSERGVPTELAWPRITDALDKIGRQPIVRALRSMDPWREIKALANQSTPKLQLVLPSELQMVIETKAKEGSTIGDKQKKTKHEKPRKEIQLKPEEIFIPDWIFCDQFRQPIGQTSFGSIGSEAKGLVVLSVEKAIPYLCVVQAISKHGLALVILEHQDPMLHGIGETTRFPARCEKTGEAILITARIMQIGAIQVVRSTPEAKTRVDEVFNHVVRTVTSRDEIDKMSWKTFISCPVKHVIADVDSLKPDQDGRSPSLDVRDRQFLNDKLERTTPDQSTIFMACFRFELADMSTALPTSGREGHYFGT